MTNIWIRHAPRPLSLEAEDEWDIFLSYRYRPSPKIVRAAAINKKAVTIAPTAEERHRSNRLQAQRLLHAMDASEGDRAMINGGFAHLT